jgi:phosphate/sulfate permease
MERNMSEELNSEFSPSPPPQQRNNTVLIVVIVVVVLLLLCCCIVVLGGWFYGDRIIESMGALLAPQLTALL